MPSVHNFRSWKYWTIIRDFRINVKPKIMKSEPIKILTILNPRVKVRFGKYEKKKKNIVNPILLTHKLLIGW